MFAILVRANVAINSILPYILTSLLSFRPNIFTARRTLFVLLSAYMELKKLIDTVRHASLHMVDDPTGVHVTQKDGAANIVTSSDIAVQDTLMRMLSEACPDSRFLCEEGDIIPEDVCNDSDSPLWIIDPIDGTANYARGIRECAIAVGMYLHGAVQLAVVYLPRSGECFSAERGKGAWLNGTPIHVSSRPFSDSVMCTAMCVYHKENARVCSDIIMETYMQSNDVRRFGAAAPELCFLAMGRVELFFEYMLSPWDYAAASLILTEAGGCISDLRGKEVNPTCPSGILAANTADNLLRLTDIVRRHIR